MITITAKNGFKNGYTVQGHAGYAARGQDIVCASVSAITQTAILGLQRYTQPHIEQRGGFLDVQLYETSAPIEAILTAMQTGLEHVSKKYEKYVQIKEEFIDGQN